MSGSADYLRARIEQARSGLQTANEQLSGARGLCKPGNFASTVVNEVQEELEFVGDIFIRLLAKVRKL